MVEQKEQPTLSKPRISRAMRAMLKKSGQTINVKELVKHTTDAPSEEVDVKGEDEIQKTYRDEQYYINPEMPITQSTDQDFLGVERDDVAKLTASMNDALFELMPDDAQSMTSKRKIVRWDNKRKRYVRGTVGELKDNTHIRNESGQLIKSKSKVKRGELYDKWKSRNHMNEQAIGDNSEKTNEMTRGRHR